MEIDEIDGSELMHVTKLLESKVLWRNYDTGDLELNLDLLKEYNILLFEYFMNNPEHFNDILKSNLKEVFDKGERRDKNGNILEVSSTPKNIINFKIINFPKNLFMPISHLRSENLSRLVMVRGILKMVIKPTTKIERVFFECPSCGTMITITQEDNTIKNPVKCSCGKRGPFRVIKEEYKNIQQMEIEENLEDVGSRQPQKVRLLLSDNLTDPEFNKLQVGNKVEIIGVLMKMPKYISEKDKDKVVVDYLINVMSIKCIESMQEDFHITEEDFKKIQDISKNNPLEILSSNIAPTIEDLDFLKKSIILYLAKGVTKYLPNGERKRGEIHILVVSDPGLAKSTLAENIRKKCINCRLADGKGSSKAGLVYATLKDSVTGNFALEAGDIILANGGYLILDEFDKISEVDREAIHGPMERGDAIVSKAGIHANLKAETSILALANPRTSSFAADVPIISQIDLPSSLLSRFDLIFAIKDTINEEKDKKRALKILSVHRGEVKQELDLDIIKKYILYCSRLKPVITSKLDERISSIFSRLRKLSTSNGRNVGVPINNRHLEGIIRMAEAHAKLRLSDTVEDIDIDIAEELFITSLNQFGYDENSQVYDLSRITTKIRPAKKDKYYSALEVIKQLFRTKNEWKTSEIVQNFQDRLGLNYGESLEVLELLHKQSEIYESSPDTFKINSKNL